MRINNNLMAMNTHRQLGINSNAGAKSIEKLSSGYRINRAGDDAAGLAISEKMRGQIRGLNQASRNSQDAISLVQTAEGALNETQAILQRMRELSVQSANDTNVSIDRDAIQNEIDQLTTEIDRIGDTTEFNTRKLLNGGAGIQATFTDETGAALPAASDISVIAGTASVKAGEDLFLDTVKAATNAELKITAGANNENVSIGTGGASLELNGITVSIAANADSTAILTAFNNVSSQTGVTASYTAATAGTAGELVLTSDDIGSAAKIDLKGAAMTITLGAATDTFVDDTPGGGPLSIISTGFTPVGGAANVTAYDGTAALAGATTTSLTGHDAFATIDAAATTGIDPTSVSAKGNVVTVHGGDYDGLELKVGKDFTTLDDIKVHVDANGSLSMQIGANEGQDMNVSLGDMRAEALGVNAVDISSATNAKAAITTINDAITSVSTERAKLGAVQNRLEHTIKNLDTSAENLQASESRIRDVDMAKEMMEFTKNNILQQAAQSMLAQANNAPQGVLQLLR